MALIGIVPSWVEERKITVNQDYVEAVIRAGGTPVLFPVTSDSELISSLLDRVDGLLLTGGVDVDPARYREEKKPCCGNCSSCRDSMEFPMCREALNRRMPIFAICRGMQVLSCVLGGNLYQDIAEQFGTSLLHSQYEFPCKPVHTVGLRPGTLLSSIVRCPVLHVNSRHHQAIRTPGNGLVINASSPDGLTEGVELPGFPFVLGVQWHPESLSDRYPEQQELFNAFVKACNKSA